MPEQQGKRQEREISRDERQEIQGMEREKARAVRPENIRMSGETKETLLTKVW